MSIDQWKYIIDEAVRCKIFQIAIGGGEPLSHPQIKEFLEYATLKINVCTTTNGNHILDANILKLFRQINVSYHCSHEKLENFLELLKNNNILRGINFVVKKSDMHELRYVESVAKKYDADLLLLSYKPVIGDWDEVIPVETIKTIANNMVADGITVSVDSIVCGKCYMATKFVTIDVDGNVHPCSFVKNYTFGNILKESFEEIWKRRETVKLERCPYEKT